MMQHPSIAVQWQQTHIHLPNYLPLPEITLRDARTYPNKDKSHYLYSFITNRALLGGSSWQMTEYQFRSSKCVFRINQIWARPSKCGIKTNESWPPLCYTLPLIWMKYPGEHACSFPAKSCCVRWPILFYVQLYNNVGHQIVPRIPESYVATETASWPLSICCLHTLRWVAQAVQCLSTGWTTGRYRFDPRRGQRIFPLASVSRPTLGPTQPPVQWVPGVLSPGLKRPECDADHSPSSNAEVVNE
jgi:hypothetical protein